MKLSTKNTLTPDEAKRRAELEAIIKPGLQDCLKVGAALREMSDSRLYRNTHTSFKEYVEDVYKTNVRTAYELVEHSEIVEQVKNECADFAQSATPSQTRTLKKVPREKRAKVIEIASEKAKEEGKPITAKVISRAAREVCTPEPELDPEEQEATDLQAFELELKGLVQSIRKGVQLKPYVDVLSREMAGLWDQCKVQVNRVQDRNNLSAYSR